MRKLLFYGLVLSLHVASCFSMTPEYITVKLAENRTVIITPEQFNQLKKISEMLKNMVESFPGEDITSLELQLIDQQSFEHILEIGQLPSGQQENRLKQLSNNQLHNLILGSDFLLAEKLLENAFKEFILTRDLFSNLPLHLQKRMADLQLFKVIAENDLEKVKQALLAGARINAKGEKGWTPLHIAVRHNYPEIVKFLINHKADPTIKDDNGETPVDIATSYPELIQIFVEAAY